MLNEFSTNESPTQSPSKNLKEIEKKHIKSNFSKFPSFYSNIFKIQMFSENKIEKEKIYQISKPKKKFFKKITKKKIRCNALLLDFDTILKELFQNKNLNNMPAIRKKEKSQFPKLNKKKFLAKKRKLLYENNNIFFNGKEKSKNNIFNYINHIKIVNSNFEKENNFKIKEKLKKNIENQLYDELSDSFFEENNIEVSYIIDKYLK